MDMEALKPLADALSAAVYGGNEEETRRIIGALMGKVTSDRKAAAAAANGRKGGRPKGYSPSAESREKTAKAMRERHAGREEVAGGN